MSEGKIVARRRQDRPEVLYLVISNPKALNALTAEMQLDLIDKLRAARLFGTVAAEGISKPENGPGVNFLLADKDNPDLTMNVSYRGAVPDTFKPGAEVIVEGGMSDRHFAARTLMTKCPSKYQKENRKEG